MGTLEGFPNPPALWLRRAKPGFAYAIIANGLREARRSVPGAGRRCLIGWWNW